MSQETVKLRVVDEAGQPIEVPKDIFDKISNNIKEIGAGPDCSFEEDSARLRETLVNLAYEGSLPHGSFSLEGLPKNKEVAYLQKEGFLTGTNRDMEDMVIAIVMAYYDRNGIYAQNMPFAETPFYEEGKPTVPLRRSDLHDYWKPVELAYPKIPRPAGVIGTAKSFQASTFGDGTQLKTKYENIMKGDFLEEVSGWFCDVETYANELIDQLVEKSQETGKSVSQILELETPETNDDIIQNIRMRSEIGKQVQDKGLTPQEGRAKLARRLFVSRVLKVFGKACPR